MSKRKNQLRHSRRRAMERFGIGLTKANERTLVRKIQIGDGHFVRRSSNRVSIWDVKHEETTIRVAYDAERKSIASVLTQEM